MIVNLLYSILTAGVPSDATWNKKAVHTSLTTKGEQIRDLILAKIPQNKRRLAACVICYYIKYSRFGARIQELDKNNTYSDPAQANSNDILFAELPSCDYIEAHIYKLLDPDIRKECYAMTWLDNIGAVCLQLLREAL